MPQKFIMGKEVHKIWRFTSSSGNGSYQTIQYVDGSTSCNCFGWIKRKPIRGVRTCKHTTCVELGSADEDATQSVLYSPLANNAFLPARNVPTQQIQIPVTLKTRPQVSMSGSVSGTGRKFRLEDELLTA